MQFPLTSPFSTLVWSLALALAVFSLIWFWRHTALRGRARVAVGLLRLGVMGIAFWILSNPQRPRQVLEGNHRAAILVDDSRSMDFPAGPDRTGTRLEAARDLSEEIGQASATGVQWFASKTNRAPWRTDAPERGASLLAASLRQALASEESPHSVLVISDGAAQDARDLEVVASICRQRGLPVSTLCVGGPHEILNVSLIACDAPRLAKPGTKVPVSITVRREGCRDKTLSAEILDSAGKVIDQASLAPKEGQPLEQSVTLNCTTGPKGFTGKVRVKPLEGESTVADNETPLSITTEDSKLRVLYMEGSTGNEYGLPEPCFLAQALAETNEIDVELLALNASNTAGGSVLVGWPWQTPGNFRPDPTRGYPRTREELYRYDVVICSDIPLQSFTKSQIQWTVDLVAERGGGFVMVGGNTSFGAGGWDQTPWDKMIPVDMDDFSRSTAGGTFQVFWPDAGKRHPLLAQLPLQPGEKLDDILNAHPPLFGTNLVHRAKPAATVLMRMNDESGVPLMAVQPFGRGRSMAFTSDVTFQWGTLHNREWGPQEGGTSNPNSAMRNYTRVSPDGKFNNSYYRRFWRRAVQWLAENSLRAKTTGLTASTPYLSWPADAALPVTVTNPDDIAMARLAQGSCFATVRGLPASRTRLVYDAAARRFTGSIARLPGLPENAVVEIEARAPGDRTPVTASFSVTVPQVDAESAAASAQPETLAALAKTSGGKVLSSAGEAISWLASRASAQVRATTVPVPTWPQWWVLAAALLLLSAEWLIRRFST